MSICVIYNPAAGRLRAPGRLARLVDRWRSIAVVRATAHPGHAETLAREAAEQGFAVVAAAGGDGTVHDVANGLLGAAGDLPTLAVVPLGSANDYAHSLRRQFGESELSDTTAHAVDVGRLSAAGRCRYFIESAGLGLSSRVTLESRRIRRVQGLLLYGLAACRALRQEPPCLSLRISWDNQPERVEPTLLLSILLGRREGNFPLAPQARLDDGWFDFVHAGPIARWRALTMLPRLALAGPPTRHPRVRLGRCRRVCIAADAPLDVHHDGELFCTAADGFQRIEIELLPARLRAKVCRASR